MADTTIQFIDTPTQDVVPVKAIDLGDGTFALAIQEVQGDSGVADKQITFTNVPTQEQVPIRAAELADGTFALAVQSSGFMQNITGAMLHMRSNMGAIGKGGGGLDIITFGDSLTSGYKASALSRTWAHLLKVKLQNRFNPSDVVGGYGYLPIIDYDSANAWTTLGTYNSNRVLLPGWTLEGTTDWGSYTAPGDGINKKHIEATANSKRMRLWLDATLADEFRTKTTGIEILFDCHSGTGTALVDQISSDAFVVAGSSGTAISQSTNQISLGLSGPEYGRRFGFFTGYSGLTRTSSRGIQISSNTSGNFAIRPAGVILFDGDEECGIRVHNMGRIGAQSNNTYNDNTLDATFDDLVTQRTWLKHDGRARNCRLVIISLGTNDCNATSPAVSLATFEAGLQTLIDRVTALDCGVLLLAQPAYDTTLEEKPIPYSDYISTMAGMTGGNVGFLDMNAVYQAVPDAADKARWFDATTKHHNDYGNTQMAIMIEQAILKGLGF